MSSVRLRYQWPDGSFMESHVWADDESPVAMAVARVTAVEALFEGMAELDADIDDDVLFPPDTES